MNTFKVKFSLLEEAWFENEDEVFESLHDSCDELSRAIANATQV